MPSALAALLKKAPTAMSQAERRELAQIKDAVNAEWRQYHDYPEYQRELASVLVENFDYGFTFEDLFGTYMDTEQVGFDDRPEIRERRGLRVFHVARGGQIEQSTITTQAWELPRDGIGFHVAEHEDKLAVGFADSLADLVRLGNDRLSAERKRWLFSLLQTATSSAQTTTVNGLSSNQAALNTAIRTVKDAVLPTGQARLPITIIGRAPMVDQISSFTGYGWEALEEIRILGRLGTYRGANIVEVLNYVDENNVSYIPANVLFVLSATAGKFVTYGQPKVKNWQAGGSEYLHTSVKIELGGVVHHPERVAVIADSSVSP